MTTPRSYHELKRRPRLHARVVDITDPTRLGVVVGKVSSDGYALGCDVNWHDGERSWDELRLLAPTQEG
jgi:hypothetical protein